MILRELCYIPSWCSITSLLILSTNLVISFLDRDPIRVGMFVTDSLKNRANLSLCRLCNLKLVVVQKSDMASNLTSEVFSWLASISGPGLNLERLAYEFESRGFRSKHSLKYLEKGDLEIIINSPQKLLLAEKKILEKELSLLQKTAAAGVPFGSCLEPKELFPTSSSWTT